MGTGTSQGVPIIACNCKVCTSEDQRDKRLRCSILLTLNQKNVVIDAGPDFRQQMLRTGVRSLEAVLLTHEHNDHVIGLDDVRPFNFRQRQAMPIYAVPRVQKEVKSRFSYVFQPSPYPGAPNLELKHMDKSQPFEIAGMHFQPIEVMHGKMPVLGFRVGDFTYITDAKTISPEELDKVRGTRLLVLNALHHKEHHSHLNLEQALAIINEVQPEQAYLTHISHQMGRHDEISELLPPGVALAYDGLRLQTNINR
ncbi:MAG: MBL fold metallo-hydrolase [Bacteroidota bacterium]